MNTQTIVISNPGKKLIALLDKMISNQQLVKQFIRGEITKEELDKNNIKFVTPI